MWVPDAVPVRRASLVRFKSKREPAKHRDASSV